MARLQGSCACWLKFSSLTSAKVPIGSSWFSQMLWTQKHAALHLHAFSSGKSKSALSTEYDLIQMLTSNQQHYEVISAKQMWWLFLNFPRLHFLYSLLEMQVILQSRNTTLLKTCKRYLVSNKITVLLVPIHQNPFHFQISACRVVWNAK